MRMELTVETMERSVAASERAGEGGMGSSTKKQNTGSLGQ